MKKNVGLEWLHQHTDYSLLDGYAQVEEYAERAVQINMKHLAVTDHGMMGAIPRQIRACEVVGISPVFGIELYVNNKHVPKSVLAELPENEKKEAGKNYHLLALAYTKKGYSNLVQLSSKAWLQFYKKPRVTHEQLLAHKEGIIFTSCCYIGEIGQAFDRYGPDAAEDMLLKYVSWFNPNFYLEMMFLDFKKQKPYNVWLLSMHAKYGIPMIVTNDCHYARKQDSQQQRYMLMIRGKKTIKDFENIEDGADYFELQDSNLWMKSEEELDEKWIKDYADVIPDEVYTQAKLNTVEIARKASGVEIDRSIKLPQIPDADDKFKEAVVRGYKWRGLGDTPKYLRRLKEEYELITRKGFASYFLIQQQLADEARRICPQILGWGNGDEAIGPGRGCLRGDVKVVMKNGTCKPISQVEIGEYVITRDGSSRRVNDVLKYDCSEKLLNIKTYYGDNAGVTLTFDHKVLVELEGNLVWKPAIDIKESDWLFTPKPFTSGIWSDDYCKALDDGILVRVRKITEVDGDGKVYDLTVDGNHNYLTTSFLVHNSAAGSLVCYCLGITDVDPLKHDLLFSRFLSENRGGREMKTRFTFPLPESSE